MPDAAIQLTSVTKQFRDKLAVDDLDLTVPTGSLMGFLGPNGAGKTTTIRMVMSIFPPDTGSVSVLGKASATESKDRIGYLPEERGVYRKMRVGQFLRYVGTLKGVPSRELNQRIDIWLERVKLPEVRKKKCEELSKGMQQKIQFIATVIHEPELIILDEPFSGLDPVNQRLLRDLVQQLHDEGRTIIFSTHVLEQAEKLCDRVVMIDQGKKIREGTVDDVRSSHAPPTLVIVPPGAVPSVEAEAITERLSQIPGVTEARMTRDQTFEARLEEHADHQNVMQAAVALGPASRVELRRATLEDVFIDLIGASIAEREQQTQPAVEEVEA
ncbi:MAG: ATP-binding cassette domain-containing protein [Planctomycetota bacterium]